MNQDRFSLEEIIEKWLREGKNATHPDFNALISWFTKARITELALKIKKKIEEEKKNELDRSQKTT